MEEIGPVGAVHTSTLSTPPGGPRVKHLAFRHSHSPRQERQQLLVAPGDLAAAFENTEFGGAEWRGRRPTRDAVGFVSHHFVPGNQSNWSSGKVRIGDPVMSSYRIMSSGISAPA